MVDLARGALPGVDRGVRFYFSDAGRQWAADFVVLWRLGNNANARSGL
jgi:hypothetical protein